MARARAKKASSKKTAKKGASKAVKETRMASDNGDNGDDGNGSEQCADVWAEIFRVTSEATAFQSVQYRTISEEMAVGTYDATAMLDDWIEVNQRAVKYWGDLTRIWIKSWPCCIWPFWWMLPPRRD